jgi:hypothetical protein
MRRREKRNEMLIVTVLARGFGLHLLLQRVDRVG